MKFIYKYLLMTEIVDIENFNLLTNFVDEFISIWKIYFTEKFIFVDKILLIIK